MPIGAETGATTPGGEMPPAGGGAPAGGGMPPVGGAPAGGAPEMGGGMPPEAAAPPAGGAPPLAEGKGKMSTDEFNRLVEKLVGAETSEPERKKSVKHKKVINENNAIVENQNKKALEMVNEINTLLNAGESINTQHGAIDGGEDVDFEEIENLDLEEK